LIQLGRRLESEAKQTGQFRGRPSRLAGFIAEPFASSLIYPGSLSAWLYLAIVLTNPVVAVAAAVAVMVLGCAATTCGVRRMVASQRVDDSVLGLIPADTGVDIDGLARSAGMTGACLERIVRRLQMRGELSVDGPACPFLMFAVAEGGGHRRVFDRERGQDHDVGSLRHSVTLP
jgi:hypothetical protein